MITEIYACGRNGVSAFVIVEGGIQKHYGTHKWGDNIAFDGITVPTNDLDCEVLAVICAIMMCKNEGCQLVNIYTDNDNAQRRYQNQESQSVFLESFIKYSLGMDVFAEKWNYKVLNNGDWIDNHFVYQCEFLTEVH